MFRSGNPTLKQDTFDVPNLGAASMTMNGVVGKSALMLALCLSTAAYTWFSLAEGVRANDEAAIARLMTWAMVSVVAGLVLAVITVFKKEWAPVTGTLYALVEGVVVGAVSMIAEMQFPGIVLQAVGLTFGVFVALLLAYTSGWIRVTDNMRLGIVAATGGIALLYLVNMGMSFFGRSIPMIHEGGPIGIGFSVLVVGIAAMNLVLDFDFIERGVERRAPQYLEWYAAFGLLVTLIWLYFEILRLLRKLRK